MLNAKNRIGDAKEKAENCFSLFNSLQLLKRANFRKEYFARQTSGFVGADVRRLRSKKICLLTSAPTRSSCGSRSRSRESRPLHLHARVVEARSAAYLVDMLRT